MMIRPMSAAGLSREGEGGGRRTPATAKGVRAQAV
jgi:hypothetical protein